MSNHWMNNSNTSSSKKRKSLLVFMLICIMALQLLTTQAQIIITLQLPPPGQFNPENFTQMVVFNNLNPGPAQVSMVGTVEEETAGLIFNGSTGVFQLPPGFYNPHYSVYEPVDIEYIDAEYEQFVITTNNLPPGDYVFCISVIDAITGDELGFQCVPHSVFQPSAPMLAYPIEGSHVPEPFPVFTWLSPAPLPPVEMHYRLTMVEVFADQSPYEAMLTNPPFFTDHEIFSVAYPYPAYAPPLQPDRVYAWRVQALMGQGIPVGENNGYSETAYFYAGDESIPGLPFERIELVHCVMENYTFLLPADVCEALGGTVWDGTFEAGGYLVPDWDADTSSPFAHLGNRFANGTGRTAGHFASLLVVPYDDFEAYQMAAIASGNEHWPVASWLTARHIFEPDSTFHFSLVTVIDTAIIVKDTSLSDKRTMFELQKMNDELLPYDGPLEELILKLGKIEGFDQTTDPIRIFLETDEAGQHELQYTVVFSDNSIARAIAFVDFPSEEMIAATTPEISEMFSVAASYYDRRWRIINDRIYDLRGRAKAKNDELNDIYALWGFLEEQNRIIDRIPRIYGPRVSGIKDEMDKLPQNPDVPTDEDIANLEDAVSQAGSEIDDCDKRVKELEERIAELEQEAEDLEQEQLDAMEDMHQIFMQYGWTGSYGFRGTDRNGGYGEGSGAHWGYVGTPGNGPDYGTADNARLFELQQKARKARKEWRKKRESIDRLKEELENAKKECDKLRVKEAELEQELANAIDAQAQQEAHDAQQALLESQLEDICREIKDMLEALATWCNENPNQCTFAAEIESLMEDCPPEDWDAYWQKFRQLIAKKKDLEESLENDVERVQDEIDRINEDIEKANDEANALLQDERQERERAERARKDSAASAKAAEEQKAKELRDCLEKFAKWVADNEQYLKRGNTEVLEKILDGATAAGDVAGGAAGAAAGGKPMGPAIGSALAQSLFNLGVSIFYAWVGDKASSAVKKIADRHVLQLIAASLIGDKRKCGVIKTDGATSYFFFKDGNRTIVFRISASFGLECLGET